MTTRVGIAGVSGYAGGELLRLLRAHPGVELTVLCAGHQAGEPLAAIWPGMRGTGLPPVTALDPDRLATECDVVFLALPNGASSAVVPELLGADLRVVDLGSDFRFADPEQWARIHGRVHPCGHLCPEAVRGLPELDDGALASARLVALPGCLATATLLAAHPLVHRLGADFVVANVLAGLSGAGRGAHPLRQFAEAAESACALSLGGTHRQRPEIRQALQVPLAFTPHVVPMTRGIVATVVARLDPSQDQDSVSAAFAQAYAAAPCVRLVSRPSPTKAVRGTGRADLCVAWDAAAHTATATVSIDNLGKGAAGQAVQVLNAWLDLPTTTAIPLSPTLP